MARAARALALLACLAGAAAAPAWLSGTATFTNGPPGNDASELKAPASLPNAACGFGPIIASQFGGQFAVAGVSLDSSALTAGRPQRGCGSCVEVRCADKTACKTTNPVTLTVFDNCDKCSASQINLQAVTFAKLAALDLGRVPIEWRQVPCAFESGVIVEVDAHRPRAIGGGWLRASFKNVNGDGLKAVKLIGASGNGKALPMKSSFGAAWELSSLPELPYSFELTDTNGKTLLLKSVIEDDKTGPHASAANF